MRALILAAGRTTGMGERDDQRPKCLIPLAGKPLLDRQIAALRGGGATEIGIVRGYRAEMIAAPDITCFENPLWAQADAVASLAAASQWLRNSPVVVSDANVFYRHDIVHRVGSVRGALAIAYDRQWRDLWTRRFADPLAHAHGFRRTASGVLLEIGGKSASINDVDGQFMGLMKITPVAWQAAEALLARLDAPTRDQLDIIGLLQRLLAAKSVAIGSVGTDGQWGRIDRPEDVALYESMLAEHKLTLEG